VSSDLEANGQNGHVLEDAPELVVIVPSRGRPEAVAELAAAFSETCTARTRLVFAIDDDDPAGHLYLMAVVDRVRESGQSLGIRSDSANSMVEALNQAARAVVGAEHPPYAVAFLGDDHRPRTRGWDTEYLTALRQLGSGLVYGDDLVRGEALPTQVAMTADIVRALGWMAPPVLGHLYVDDFWRNLGVHAGCIRYLRHVIVEHLHPVAGTAELDAGYERVNAPEVYARDEAAWRRFIAEGAFAAAVAAVKALQPADPKRERLIGMARASLVAEAAYLTGGRTVADVAEGPTDLAYLLGPALQLRHSPEPLAADVVCVTGLQAGAALALGSRAAVIAGVPLTELAAAGYTLLRTRTIGDYPIALGVRR